MHLGFTFHENVIIIIFSYLRNNSTSMTKKLNYSSRTCKCQHNNQHANIVVYKKRLKSENVVVRLLSSGDGGGEKNF